MNLLPTTDALAERYHRAAGSTVEHDVRPYFAAVDRIEAVGLADLPRPALTARASELRARAAREPLDALLTEVFAVARELAPHAIGLRPFDVQLAAGVALARGRLAQLATGEGKTLAAVLPAILRGLTGHGVHIFTANDYLAQRDATWMAPLYGAFGLRCASINEGLGAAARRDAYAADVTYVTAREAGFDYLRDLAALDPRACVHRGHRAAIVDEADCILVDEARVPLVIAGAAPSLGLDPGRLASLARMLRPGADYTADEYARTVVLTDRGFAHAGEMLGVSLDDPVHHLLLSAVHVALHAEVLLHRDRDYVVRDGRIEIVDEWTGRVADNRRWPNGIQPAVEAKEQVPIRAEGRVLGSIPMQHFIRLYDHLAGLTATAIPAAEELAAFFGLETTVFPPHQTCRRVDEPDVVFSMRAAKEAAVISEIARVHATGRPILVGTTSVRESDALGAALAAQHIPCAVLNARQDADEARIVAAAGRLGAVTISTNMAGRGTDIVLGGGDLAEHAAVCARGGLYVLGTNRHESRRIDDQLRGRAGRQGDPGTSRFFISLQDDLMERYGVLSLIPPAHRPLPGSTPVVDPIVSREIARAQRIVEGQNFEIRRTLWKYSGLVEEQRRIVADWRQALLTGEADPAICAAACPEHYAALERAGREAVQRAEQRLVIQALDDRWADHLAAIEDIREGIHLQRFGGREPVTEFHRQIVEGFESVMADVRDQTAERFQRLRLVGGEIDLAAAGLGGSSTTWTYLVNDNPFSTFGLSLLAGRNVGAAGAMGMLAVLYWPLTAVVASTVFVRRWIAARGRRTH
ncbi:MAG: accessory Sec system translocase SecA2 [Vicinamibacterales bacterium]